MTYKKCLTAKQRLNAVLISDDNGMTSVMVVRSDNKFSLHEKHKAITPSLELGYKQEFIDKFEEFDIQPVNLYLYKCEHFLNVTLSHRDFNRFYYPF